MPTAEIASPAPLARTAAILETGNTLKILAIGSSSTTGIGASSVRKNYPSQLQLLLQKSLKGVSIEIVNRGVSGEIASQTAKRLLSESALLKPDLVLWQLGTNDALSRIPTEDFEQTVRSTLKLLRENNIDVILVGLQYTPKFAKDSHYFAVRETLRRIAQTENVLYVSRYNAMLFIARTQANAQMLASDDFHLNDFGYQCMAEHVAQAVTTNLFVRRLKLRTPTN